MDLLQALAQQIHNETRDRRLARARTARQDADLVLGERTHRLELRGPEFQTRAPFSRLNALLDIHLAPGRRGFLQPVNMAGHGDLGRTQRAEKHEGLARQLLENEAMPAHRTIQSAGN